MMLVTLLSVMTWITTSLGENRKTYEISRIGASPGLYFERLHTMRLMTADWRVMIFLDTHKLETQFPTDYKRLNETYNYCISLLMANQCDSILRRIYLNGRIEEALALRLELRELLSAIQVPEDFHNPRTIVRRSVPFGFIGSLSHALFGTLTTEDAEYFNSEIDKLYQEQYEITQVIKNQTHIITSKLHKYHEALDRNTKLMNENRIQINQLSAAVKDVYEVLNYTRVTYWLSHYAHSLELSLDQYIKVTEKFLAAIYAARAGEVHGLILDRSKFRRIITDIRNTQTSYDLPIPQGYQGIEELIRLSSIKIGHHNGRLLLVLHLPLVDGVLYHLYRSYSWPMPQKFTRNSTGSSYVHPKFPYLAISNDHRFYFNADELYINSCHRTSYAYLCPLNQPLFEVSSTDACEVSLLLRPTIQVFKHCDVRIRPQHTPFWARLTSTQGWLYSLETPESVQIICSGMKDDLITMEGTGILHLRPGCIAKTTYVTLVGIQHLESKEQYLYQPNLLLNVSELLPQIHKYHDIRPLDTKHVSTPIVEDTMSAVEEKLDEIGRHHRNKRFSTHLLHGGLAISSFLGLGILLYYFRSNVRRVWSLVPCRRWKSRTPPEETNASNEVTRGCSSGTHCSPATASLPCQRAIVD